jgi:hypothetical protein
LRFRAIAQNGASRDSRAGMAEPATTGALNEQQVLLSTLPPSRGQQRLALAIVVVLLAAFCATVPFATVPDRLCCSFNFRSFNRVLCLLFPAAISSARS